MKIRKNNKGLLQDFLRGSLIGLFVGLLICIYTDRMYACTYEEALDGDWSGYNYMDVVRILNEDMTVPSKLTEDEKKGCLIAPMSDFYKEFDKRAKGIKYEALAAISALETGYFTSEVSKSYNNVGGLMNSDGYFTYKDKEEGIKALSDLLVKGYLKKDGKYYSGKSILEVGRHYNPSAHWVQMYVKVRLDMEERIEGLEEFKVKKEISESRKHILAQARKVYGSKNQLIVSAEECNELALALLKFIRYEREDKGISETYEKVLEERADVEIILDHIDNIYGFSEDEILKVMNSKIDRLKRWTDKTNSMEYTTIDRGFEDCVGESCEDCFYFSHFDEAVEKCVNCVDYKAGYRKDKK